MPPKPDLASHTLASFLDRFVYRNAKSAASSGGPRGGSIMQPLSGGDSRGVLISNKSATHMQGPLNTEAFWRKKAEDVAVDEVFFHKYFSQIGKGKQASKAKPTKGEDGSENGEDENEDEIWDALVNSRPDVEGPSDSESDMEMHDLDSSDAELSDDDEVIINMDDDDDAEGSDMADDDGFETEEEDGSEDGGVVLDDDESEADSEMDALFAKELEKAKTDEEPAAEGEKETSRQKKKKLKGLPTFASAEDYASMLDNDADEDF